MNGRQTKQALFLYSLVCITILILVFGWSQPSWIHFLTILLLSPLSFYFWISFTNPHAVNSDVWSKRFVISVALLIGLGVVSYRLHERNNLLSQEYQAKGSKEYRAQIEELQKTNQELAQKIESVNADLTVNEELSAIKEELSRLSVQNKVSDNSELNDLYGILAEYNLLPLGQISVLESSKVDYYAEADKKSLKLGELLPNQSYPYFDENSNWFQVEVNSRLGWVEKDLVTEKN
jgi:hypothetical protein